MLDLWNALHDLPAFWDSSRFALLGANLTVIIAIATAAARHVRIGSKKFPDGTIDTPQELRSERRWEFAQVFTCLAIACACLWAVALWLAHDAHRANAASDLIVDHVETNYDLVVMSPVSTYVPNGASTYNGRSTFTASAPMRPSSTWRSPGRAPHPNPTGQAPRSPKAPWSTSP